MTEKEQFLSDLRHLETDRRYIQTLRERVSAFSSDYTSLSEEQNKALPDWLRERIETDLSGAMGALILKANHVSCLENMLLLLDPDERLVIDAMLVHPQKHAALSLMGILQCEKTRVYTIRAAPSKKSCAFVTAP